MAHISNGEYLISILLEQAFPGYKFGLIKPEWLVNPITGGIMELDLYNEELNLALEYQGMFHFCDVEIKNPKTLKKYQSLIRNDAYKKQICLNRKINFITIDYDLNYINVTKIRKFLYEELIKCGYNIPNEFLNMKIKPIDTNDDIGEVQDTENFLLNIDVEEFRIEGNKNNTELYINAIDRLLVRLSLYSTKIRELERKNKVLESEIKKIDFSRKKLFIKIEELYNLKEEYIEN